MAVSLFAFVRQSIDALCQAVKRRLRHWTRTDTHDLVPNAVLDMTRCKSELVLENTRKRQKLIVLKRGGKRSTLTGRDQAVLAEYSRPIKEPCPGRKVSSAQESVS